jgi:hypothetical protein
LVLPTRARAAVRRNGLPCACTGWTRSGRRTHTLDFGILGGAAILAIMVSAAMLTVGADAGRIVVGGARDDAGTEPPEVTDAA